MEVAAAVLGDAESGDAKDPDRVDLGNAPSFEMAIANINSALNFG